MSLRNDKFSINLIMELVQKYISINSEIRFGKLCIKGTRISVSDVLNWFANGMKEDEIIEDYPFLTSDQLRAALYFASNREELIKVIAA
jgi:uncharacterized protein (DUF433 family)